jgi:putative phage-type endonuclease
MATGESVEQGTVEWQKLRLGKITASRFKDMMTNGRGKDTMGQTAYSYMRDLITERLTGQPQDQIDNKALRWGNDNEPQARAMYCILQDVRVEQVGFIQHPAFPDVGCSPDGLVNEGADLGGAGGGVEIKCPMNSRIHLSYIEEGGVPKEYHWQVQGSMWVTGRPWWDFVSFDPRMPKHLQLFVHREYADDEALDDLDHRARRFLEQLEVKLKKINGESIGK